MARTTVRSEGRAGVQHAIVVRSMRADRARRNRTLPLLICADVLKPGSLEAAASHFIDSMFLRRH